MIHPITIFTWTSVGFGDRRRRKGNSRPIRVDRKGEAGKALKDPGVAKSCHLSFPPPARPGIRPPPLPSLTEPHFRPPRGYCPPLWPVSRLQCSISIAAPLTRFPESYSDSDSQGVEDGKPEMRASVSVRNGRENLIARISPSLQPELRDLASHARPKLLHSPRAPPLPALGSAIFRTQRWVACHGLLAAERGDARIRWIPLPSDCCALPRSAMIPTALPRAALPLHGAH
jgi:hypothetical protein